jgi:hypothetical protein
LGPREKSDGVTDESDERKCADSAKGVGASSGLMLFAFKSDEERQEEDEDDLYGIGWQPAVEVH